MPASDLENREQVLWFSGRIGPDISMNVTRGDSRRLKLHEELMLQRDIQ
jgi:hypothetical protein